MELVYFLRAEHSGLVKIGWTANIVDRVIRLRHSCPYDVRLLAIQPGPRQLEMAYHANFRSAHQHAEWFRFDDEVIRWLVTHMRHTYAAEWAEVVRMFDETVPELRHISGNDWTYVRDILDPGLQPFEESLDYVRYNKPSRRPAEVDGE